MILGLISVQLELELELQLGLSLAKKLPFSTKTTLDKPLIFFEKMSGFDRELLLFGQCQKFDIYLFEGILNLH